MELKYNYSDIFEGLCTSEEYIAQFNPIQLKVGEVYVQHKGDWCERHFKVVHLEGPVALAICVGGLRVGDYGMFYAANGFAYQDTARPEYRLIRELKDCSSL